MQRTCVLRQGFNIAVSRDRGKASGSGSCQRPSEKWANGTARRPRRVIRVVSVTGFQRPGGFGTAPASRLTGVEVFYISLKQIQKLMNK